MAAEASVFYRILTEVQRALQRDIVLSPEANDTVSKIDPSAIVIRKLVAKKPGERAESQETCPGILLTPGRRIPRPPQAGVNTHEEVIYSVLCQIVASDYDKGANNLATYLKWAEQVARLMSHWFAFHPISSGGFGSVHDSDAVIVTTVDEKKWVLHQKFVMGVMVQAIAWETRGVT